MMGSSSSPPPTPPLSSRHVERGVAVNPTQIEAIDSAASTTTTVRQSRPKLSSEAFLPADFSQPHSLSTRTTTLTTATVPPSHCHPPPSDPSDPSAPLESAVGVSRLPQSGLVLCGRKWLLGAEDMFIPACLSLLSDLFVFVLALVAIGLLPTAYSSMPALCSETDFDKLRASVVLHVLLFFLLTVIDVGTMFSAWYSDMFERNRTVPLFLYLRMAVSVLIAVAALASSAFFFSTVRAACTRPYGYALDLTCFALFVSSLVMISFLVLYFACSYGAGQLCAPREEDGWKDWIGKWFIGGGGGGEARAQGKAQGDHDVFSSVATIFSEFFSSSLPSSSIHVVPSDVAVALCLVQGMQRKRRRMGEKFYMAAGKRRWDVAYIERYYDDSVRKAEEEERRKRRAADGRDQEEQHRALKGVLSAHAAERDAPLPIKQGTSPHNAYSIKIDDDEEKARAVKAERETVPAAAPAVPTTNGEAVPVEVQQTEEEAHQHEEHLAAGPSFADRDEEDRRSERRLNTPRPSVQPDGAPPLSPVQRERIAEMTEIVTESGQQADDLANAAPGGKDEKTHSDPQDEDVNPYEGGDNITGEDDEDMAEVALSGRQPRLLPMDWEKVAEGKHYYDFACGSYGWMLYTFNHLSSLATCALCCRHTPLDAGEMEGSGCSPLPCLPSYKVCMLSVRAFEIQSRVPSREILYCHLQYAPVYYVVVDREKKALVIAVRGTLSIADALIDLDAQLASLAPYGYPYGYTHQGILQNALHCRDHIDRKGVVAAFLRMNPDYSLVVVGHSLGAGTAACLTLILRQRFARRQGVHAHCTHDALVGDGAQADQAAARRLSPGRPGPSSTLPSHEETADYSPRSLHCYIFGCPLLVDPITAQSPFAMSSITTFIYHDDMIARLSLASLFHLKQQMVEAYERSESRKWRIMRLAWGSQWEALEKYDVKRQRKRNRNHQRHHHLRRHTATPASLPPPSAPCVAPQPVEVELQSAMVEGSGGVRYPHEATAPLPTRTNTAPGRTYPPSTQPVQVTTTAIEEQTYTTAEGETMTTVTEKKSTFSIQLRKMYLPGRIYLLLPVSRKKKTQQEDAEIRRGGGTARRGEEKDADEDEDGDADDGGCCVGRKKRWVVFPAAQESFGEVIVDGHMFNDHVPVLSAMHSLNLPRQFRER